MKQLLLDTETILHLLLNEDSEKTAVAASYFEKAERGELELLVEPIVITDCCNVLEGEKYQIERRKISDVLLQLIHLDGVVCGNAGIVIDALGLYGVNDINFAKAYISLEATTRGLGQIGN